MINETELSQAAVLAQLSLGEYSVLRSAYQSDVSGQILEYLMTEKAKVTKFKNAFKRAITETFPDAFYLGFADAGGGSREDVAKDDDAWLTAKMNAEYGFVDMLFQQLASLRSDADTTEADYQAEAERRAAGYAKTLDGVYNEGRMRGAKDKMLTFGGEDGEESCRTCKKWKGKRHKASFWIKRGLTIYRGNTNFECGCFQCQHFYFDDDGNLWTF